MTGEEEEDKEAVARARVLKFGSNKHPCELNSPHQARLHLLLNCYLPK